MGTDFFEIEFRVFGHKIRALFGNIRSNIAVLFFRDIGNYIEAVLDGDIYLYIHKKRKTANLRLSEIAWSIEVYNEYLINSGNINADKTVLGIMF